MLTVAIPATSANLGAGFDSLGIALDLWNTFSLAEEPGEGVLDGEGDVLFRRTLALVQNYLGVVLPRVWLRADGVVPPGRGLGASATVVLAGVLLSSALAERPLTHEEILNLAAEVEGHPDNVAPALLGGITISWRQGDGRVGAYRLEPPEGLVAALAVPEHRVATAKARGYLPREVPLPDAVFNVARSALFVAAVVDRRFELLAEATKDRLHQPYRAPLLPGFLEALSAAEREGAYGAFLSGSGPTVLALAAPEKARATARAMADAFLALGIPCQSLVAPLSREGARLGGVPSGAGKA